MIIIRSIRRIRSSRSITLKVSSCKPSNMLKMLDGSRPIPVMMSFLLLFLSFFWPLWMAIGSNSWNSVMNLTMASSIGAFVLAMVALRS